MRYIVVVSSFIFILTSAAFTETIQYTYDSLNRVTHVEYPDGAVIKYSYDAAGSLTSKTITSSSKNVSPMIKSFFVDLQYGPVPLTVNFTCIASDPNKDELTYQWDFDGDGNIDESTSSGIISHTYSEAGIYQALVIVKDNKGSTAVSRRIMIEVSTTELCDIDGDGKITLADVILGLQVLTGKKINKKLYSKVTMSKVICALHKLSINQLTE